LLYDTLNKTNGAVVMSWLPVGIIVCNCQCNVWQSGVVIELW